MSGAGGQAWRMHKRLVSRPGDPRDWQGTVASWFVNGNKFHPLWNWWSIVALHLRPIEGVRPPHLQFDGATHEILILSVHPDYPPNVDGRHGEEVRADFLSPPDLVHQVGGITDAQAEKMVELMVRMICNGQLSPDSDFRSVWEKTLTNTAEHLALGGHAKGRA